MSKESRLIERSDLTGGSIFTVMHKCHLPQAETEHGKRAVAKFGPGACIIGYNPYMVRHGDEPRAHCAYCNWEASAECQKYLDSLSKSVDVTTAGLRREHYSVGGLHHAE